MGNTRAGTDKNNFLLRPFFGAEKRVNTPVLRLLKMKRLPYARRDPYVTSRDLFGAVEVIHLRN